MFRKCFMRLNGYIALPDLIKPKDGPVTLPELSFDINEGLSPTFSKRQLELHYGKHHKAYVDRMNTLLAGNTEFDGLAIEQIVRKTEKGVLFNQAAQHFNHSFFWKCMVPKGKPMPASLEEQIVKSFESKDRFFQRFEEAALSNFGSGWTWLVLDPRDGGLRVVNTPNAELPNNEGQGRPILTVDVWEHAYYKDFENRRSDYLKEWWNVVDWSFVAANYDRARQTK
eukprot:PhF_6_TR4360/c0_g1_i1/m.5888/K04564/SOD2; superoxide dismutase, Fe-Mn family